MCNISVYTRTKFSCYLYIGSCQPKVVPSMGISTWDVVCVPVDFVFISERKLEWTQIIKFDFEIIEW